MQAGNWLPQRAVRAGLVSNGEGSGPWAPSWRSPAGAMWSVGRRRAAGASLLGLLLALLVLGSGAAKTGTGFVTCGSVLKLFNTQHRVRLHSHDIKYGSGARGPGLGHRQGARRSWGSASQGSVGHLVGVVSGLRGTRTGCRRRSEEYRGRGGSSWTCGPKDLKFSQGPGIEAGGKSWVPGLRLSGKVYGARAESSGIDSDPGVGWGVAPQEVANSR